MSQIDHAKSLNTLLKSLKSKYEPAPMGDRSPLEEFVYSFLLWESTGNKADLAYKRLVNAMVDFNELRVCRPPEIVALLGKNYPRAEERAQRLRAALHHIYLREFAVTLDPCAALNKREARKYLDTLEAAPTFVGARVFLLRMGGHAIPVDDRMNDKLIEAGVGEPETDAGRTGAIIERLVKAEDASKVYPLLQSWAEDAATDVKKPRGKREEPRPSDIAAKAAAEAKAKLAEMGDVKPAPRKNAPSIKPSARSRAAAAAKQAKNA